MEKIYILDAVGYLFRSYYAIGPMLNDKGQSTSALYGFIRSLLKLFKDFSPKYFVAVFDGPENKEARRKVYADYKMHRKGAPEDLYSQFDLAFQFCELFGLAALSIPGVEADDTMASIATWASKENMEVFLCTSDKDLFQLVSESVFVLNTHKDNLLVDRNKVQEIFQVLPSQMLDFLALVGDASDHIPGVEGFGPKTASTLLQEFGSLDNLFANSEKIGGKKGQLLIEQKEQALLSRELATLDLSVDFPHDKEFFRIRESDRKGLEAFYHEMKFMTLLKELESAPSKEEVIAPTSGKETFYHLVDGEKELEELEKLLKEKKEIAIDTETTDYRPMFAELVGVGVCIELAQAYYLPLNGTLGKEKVLAFLQRLVEDPSLIFFGHNLKYDWHILQNVALNLKNISFDTLLASFLLNPQNRRHNLDFLALEYFHKTKIPIESLLQKGKKAITMDLVPIEKVSEYCCEDVDYTFRLKALFTSELKKQALEKPFYDIELPLLKVLAKMERRGMYIDKEHFAKLASDFQKELSGLEEEIFKAAGKTFNINSPKQLSEILFIQMGLKVPGKKSDSLSTAAEVLEKISPFAPIVDKILQYRGFQKLLNTYAEAIPKQVHPKTSRIHSTFSQSTAATGRLSSQDPNLQNIPLHSTEGRKIREGFLPEKKGWSFLSADYSQIELRLLAHFSEDPSLIEAFQKGLDIHAHTASLVFQVPQENVTSEMRQMAKAVNFGILYGQGAFGLSQQLKISNKEAAQFIQTYFERYSKISAYLEGCKKSAEITGYALTLTGRKRPIPEITSKNPQIRAAAQRLAINTPLQGTAADIIKMAMITIDQEIEKRKLQGFMVLQIHDELLFEIPDEEIAIFQALVTEKMEGVLPLKVPLTVNISIGKNWGEC